MTSREHRAALAVACLIHLGVTETDAHAALWSAVEDDPLAGVERVLMCIRHRCNAELDPHTRVIADARALIDALSDRCAALEAELRRIHREQERGTVAALSARA